MSWVDDYDSVVKLSVTDIEIPMADLRRFYREARLMEKIREAVDRWCDECRGEAAYMDIDLRCDPNARADPESTCWPEQCKAIIEADG